MKQFIKNLFLKLGYVPAEELTAAETELSKVKADLHTLVVEPGTAEAMLIHCKVLTVHNMVQAAWSMSAPRTGRMSSDKFDMSALPKTAIISSDGALALSRIDHNRGISQMIIEQGEKLNDQIKS